MGFSTAQPADCPREDGVTSHISALAVRCLFLVFVCTVRVRAQLIAAETVHGQSCGEDWCLTFPVGNVRTTPPFGSSAWNKLIYVPDEARFFIYSSDGIYTFSNSWWSYGVLGHKANLNPWIEESTSGTLQTTVTDNSKGFLRSAITPTETTVELGEGEGKTFHPDPVRGGILVIDGEEIAYNARDQSGDIFSKVIRGVRGTTAASHNPRAIVNAGAPFPQSRREDRLVPVADHIPDRHPFLTAAYASRRHQLFQAGGIIENNKKNDTWYFCLAANDVCPTEDIHVWERLLTPTPVPARADGAMTYDSDDDIMIFYGGQNVGNPTAETWLLCFRPDPQISGTSVGCPAGVTYPNWILVSTIGSPGPRFAHATVYDSRHHIAVLFGGTNGTLTDPAETWTYAPSTRRWTNTNPSGQNPPSFRRPAMTYDSKRGRVVLFEGPPEKVADKARGGIYLYDAGAKNWEHITVDGGPIPSSPSGGKAHGRLSFDYDPRTDTFVATELGSGYSLQTWELKGSALDRTNPAH